MTPPHEHHVPETSARWSRRRFCACTAMGLLGTSLLRGGQPILRPGAMHPGESKRIATDLLLEWCEAMRRQVIHAPDQPERHGALECPACGHIHGRCMDAVYPFFHVARLTGDTRYVDAGRSVMNWAEQNVSQPDGSWTVIANPKSWAGISIFGAIALAETLHYHGDLLDAATHAGWMNRLRRAADYIHQTFTIDFTNINYPATATYGLYLFGKMLDEPEYLVHARELAKEIPAFLTSPNSLLFGEGKPSNALSARGLPAVDLGYNVEESLVALSLYAVDAGDRYLEDRLVDAWRGHLQFMLPDGGWDNSWGTRQAKWTYWGSRTSDGCQPGLAVMAHRDPVFGTAARRNLELLRSCTSNGLLHGGPHYAVRGAPPCIHHTFTHAKALAALLDRGDLVDRLDHDGKLPRAQERPMVEVPEIATWLVARGGWRATVTSYDFVYRTGIRQPSGGVVSLLWHEGVGPVVAGSMAPYVKVEVNNMQDDPHGRNDVLTPRLEALVDGRLYSQLWDLEAVVHASGDPEADRFEIHTRLRDEDGSAPDAGELGARLTYTFGTDGVGITARLGHDWPSAVEARLVWPLVALPEEPAEAVPGSGGRSWRIRRKGGTLRAESAHPLTVPPAPQNRWFSLTPGFCTVPLVTRLTKDSPEASISITISDHE